MEFCCKSWFHFSLLKKHFLDTFLHQKTLFGYISIFDKNLAEKFFFFYEKLGLLLHENHSQSTQKV